MATVLIIDDAVIIRRIIKKAILSLGNHQVLEAGCGLEVWHWLKKEKVDLVTMDWILPGESDGLDLTQEIHRVYPNLPIIFVTGEAARDKIMMALLNGAKAYIVKPFTLDILISKLKELLPT